MKYLLTTPLGYVLAKNNDLEQVKEIAEKFTDDKSQAVKIYAHIATCHPPEPQPCRWEEVGKKSDRDYDRVPLGDLPAPPEGFAFYGHGPVAGSTFLGNDGIAWMDDRQAWIKNGNGTACLPYALRIGSDIAKRNGIGGGE